MILATWLSRQLNANEIGAFNKGLKTVNDQNAISAIDSIVDDWLCRFNAALHQTSSSADDALGGVLIYFMTTATGAMRLHSAGSFKPLLVQQTF